MTRLRSRIGCQVDRWLAPFVQPSTSLVVSGFWRSGTTWIHQGLAERLRAKRVHEPLHSLVPAARRLHQALGLGDRAEGYRELFLPYADTGRLSPELLDLFERSLRGEIPGVRRPRTGFAETFRRRVVMKIVRGHLCLRAVQEHFGMPVIHIYRDPRAVVASIKMTDWAALFDGLKLSEQLLDPDDGRREFFGHFEDRIREFDRRGRAARIVAYWALIERFLGETFADSPAKAAIVGYEELCLRRGELLHETLCRVGVDDEASPRDDLDRDSVTTSRGRMGATVEDRIFGWRKVLTDEERHVVEETARVFECEDRLFESTTQV